MIVSKLMEIKMYFFIDLYLKNDAYFERNDAYFERSREARERRSDFYVVDLGFAQPTA